MEKPRLGVLIPAAGASQRLGQAKQLVKFQGSSLIQRALDLASAVSPASITVTIGAHASDIRNAVQLTQKVQWLDNPDWSSGMGGSIAIGAAKVSPGLDGLMILLCDQYCISADELRAMAGKWLVDPGRIVAATTGGQLMPPVIFPSACFDALKQLEGDKGARKVMEAHSDLVTSIPMKSAAFDLDTPADLERMDTGSSPV